MEEHFVDLDQDPELGNLAADRHIVQHGRIVDDPGPTGGAERFLDGRGAGK